MLELVKVQLIMLIVAVVMTCTVMWNRISRTIRGKLTKKQRSQSKWGVSFLLDGMICVLLCGDFFATMKWQITGELAEALLLVGGIFLMTGMALVTGYFYSVYEKDREEK